MQSYLFLLSILMEQHILLSSSERMKRSGQERHTKNQFGGNWNGIKHFLNKIANNGVIVKNDKLWELVSLNALRMM
jgi:hypothetical protein